MIMRQKVVSILALLLMAATGATAQTTYPVEVKPGITDADKWSTTPPNSAAAGETVKAKYTGTLKVKSIKYVVPVTKITLNKTETEIAKGETETLSVNSVLPEIATNKTVTWSSSNPSKASVNETTGEVTALDLTGDTPVNIIATATDGSGVTATCKVTIKAPVTTDPVNINGWTEGTTIGGGQANKNEE